MGKNRKKQVRSTINNRARSAGTADRMLERMRSRARNHEANCITFCRSVGAPATGDFDKAMVDEAHLADVERVNIVRVKTRGSATHSSGGFTVGIVANGYSLANDRASVMANNGLATGRLIIPPFGTAAADMSTTYAGWSLHSPEMSPWDKDELDPGLGGASAGNVRYAYVCSELRVYNETARLHVNGHSMGYAVPKSLGYGAETTQPSNALQASNYTVIDNIPSSAMNTAREDVSIVHIADVIEPVPTDMQVGTGVSPKAYTQVWYWTGDTTTDVSFYWEFTQVFYVWGSASGADTALIRVPGMMSCLRTAYSMPSYQPVVATSGNLNKDRWAAARRLANKTRELFAERGAEIVSALAGRALGFN